MFKLNFWGKGAAFFPMFGNTNAWFEKNNSLYCLDCGEEAFTKMANNLNLKDYDNIYVLLTHLHADHSGSLASLCSYSYFILKKRITIVHPEKEVALLLRCQGIEQGQYTLVEDLPKNNEISVEFKEVKHAENMKAYGLVLRDSDETIYYSGDAAYLRQDICELFLHNKLDRIFHDTASKEGESHCYYKRLEVLIPFELRKNVYCMHLDGDYIDMLKEHGFSVVTAFKKDINGM